jgi:hypothetical protein
MVGSSSGSGNVIRPRKVIGRMRCYGVAGSGSGEIPGRKYGKQICGKSARL